MSPTLRANIRGVLFGTGLIVASAALAEPQSTENSEIAEIVIVTGSYIRGTPEDASLPVDVISTEELEKRGAPSALETLKSLPVVGAIIGESNQFTAGRGQAGEGAVTVNLRGFGAARTLVLLNGKRLPSEDANLLPNAALARVEVLKDGAAATYGTDAIGGVVNYITREDFDGLQLGGDYRFIEDSDGDYTLSAVWGSTLTDSIDVMVAGGYFHRAQLRLADRDWAVRSFSDNPEGGFSGAGNPATFSAGGQRIVDPGCEFFGGVRTQAGSDTARSCRNQFTPFDNLVEEQDTWQSYGQINFDLTDSTRLHIDALFADTHVPHASSTPSFATSRPISVTTQPAGLPGTNAATDPDSRSFFFVPGNNPGFIALQNAPGSPIPAGATSATFVIGQYRPFFLGGNPLFDYEESFATRERQQFRINVELTGNVTESIGFTTSATYGRSTNEFGGFDSLTGRMQLALRGLGGPNCNVAANTPGANGCLWLNPFSNAIPRNIFTGEANPNFQPNLENTRELVEWFFVPSYTKNIDDLVEIDAVLNGELDFASLPGGDIGWAFGTQYRLEKAEGRYGFFNSTETNPCPDTTVNGSTVCTPQDVGGFVFLDTDTPFKRDRDVYAVFGELNLPILDSVNAQVAARFEDYGDQGGSSFDPKISLRWQALDWLAFRSSAGTTFRVPGQGALLPASNTVLANVLGTFRGIDIFGNPDLEPEEAFSWTAGMIFSADNFRATLDYFSFDIDKLLTTEPLTAVINQVFPNGTSTTLPNNCATIDPAFLTSHFEFTSAGCGPLNVANVIVQQINGSGIKNTGVDLIATYMFENVVGGDLSIGAAATWIEKYEIDPLVIGGLTLQQGFGAVGQFNIGAGADPLPQYRGQAFLEYSNNNHNIRWTTSYIDGYVDQRTAPFAPGSELTSPNGKNIDEFITHDLVYRVSLPWETTLTAAATNLFDEDPPFARTEINYDPVTANPLGRTFKLGLQKRFGSQ